MLTGRPEGLPAEPVCTWFFESAVMETCLGLFSFLPCSVGKVFFKIFLSKFIYLIYLFLAVLGLCCCAGLSLVAASGGYSSLWCAGFSLRWLLLLRSTDSRHVGLVAPRHVGSSRTRARTPVPCIGRRILNHWTTREALWESFELSYHVRKVMLCRLGSEKGILISLWI